MCRWIAYTGTPIFLDTLVTTPDHSLVQQSFDTKMNYHSDGSLWALNADGFGVGWYGDKDFPGVFKDTTPAWNDRNLKSLCAQIKSGMFFGHVRASSTGAVQRTNTHPFRYDKYLFQHNGHIEQFKYIWQDLFAQIDPSLVPEISGTTDSEVFFYLALSNGLIHNPHKGFKAAISILDKAYEKQKLKPEYSFSCAFTDGKVLYTFLYSKDTIPKTQFYSDANECAKDLGAGQLDLPDDSVVFVSEPLNRLSGQWEEVPDNSFIVSEHGEVDCKPFL